VDYIRLGRRIREERLKLGLTQARLAEDVDISEAYVGQIERGERNLALDTLVRLANRLGVSIDYLLKDSVDDTDDNIVNQFRQLIANKSMEHKQLVIDVIKTILAHLDNQG
jgi:transcriptional regulator with XRE-family HTH domain